MTSMFESGKVEYINEFKDLKIDYHLLFIKTLFADKGETFYDFVVSERARGLE